MLERNAAAGNHGSGNKASASRCFPGVEPRGRPARRVQRAGAAGLRRAENFWRSFAILGEIMTWQ